MDASMLPEEETLLIVDDDPLMRDLFREWMTRWGVRVLTAAGGQEALATVEAEAASLRLVVTDMTLPDLSGLEVVRRLYELRPDLPAIIITGYDLDPAQIGLLPNVVEIVRKPYRHRALAERIEEILSGRGNQGLKIPG